MSGGDVAYHLRPNKYVERRLFVELLQLFHAQTEADKIVYVSLGGLQLEDHKLLHEMLGYRNLVSLEADEIVYGRQRFNRRLSFVQTERMSSGEFVRDFDGIADRNRDKSMVIWLDYAAANERREQLLEFQTLLGKLEAGDVLKLTINANPATLGERTRGESHSIAFQRRLDSLLDQLGDFLVGEEPAAEDMVGRKLPRILARAVRNAALRSVAGTRKTIMPLALFSYQDGSHQMFTATVCLQAGSSVEELRSRLRARWEFLPVDWEGVTAIQIPDVTIKERLYLDSVLLSEDEATIHSNMPFRFDIDEAKSLEALREYARHIRRYPSYFQVVI